uniref:Nucleotide-diphospho-sugar transferase domain-containing protein n=1 Tax=viral metagenome TaxID=1070528 RepID=A0A6C0B0U7_9ZZZZ
MARVSKLSVRHNTYTLPDVEYDYIIIKVDYKEPTPEPTPEPIPKVKSIPAAKLPPIPKLPQKIVKSREPTPEHKPEPTPKKLAPIPKLSRIEKIIPEPKPEPNPEPAVKLAPIPKLTQQIVNTTPEPEPIPAVKLAPIPKLTQQIVNITPEPKPEPTPEVKLAPIPKLIQQIVNTKPEPKSEPMPAVKLAPIANLSRIVNTAPEPKPKPEPKPEPKPTVKLPPIPTLPPKLVNTTPEPKPEPKPTVKLPPIPTLPPKLVNTTPEPNPEPTPVVKLAPIPTLPPKLVNTTPEPKPEPTPVVKLAPIPTLPPKLVNATPQPKLVEPDFIKVPKMATINYDIPTRNDIAVLLVFFDYIGSVRILTNYLFMREKLKLANIPVFTLELVLDGKTPKIHEAIHVYGSSYLFQKEHLIRLLEKSIPENYTKLACLDADVMFESPSWYDELSILLDTNHIVQCFNRCYWLDLTYTQIQKAAFSCTQADKSKRFWDSRQGRIVHPGFGWAFRRNEYITFGFFDEAVIGSGDTLFAYGVLGYPVNVDDKETKIYKSQYTKWTSLIKGINCTYLNVNLYHLYHGPIPNRQYVSRYDAFKGISNIEDVISINNYGVCELTRPELNRAMLEFFKTRDDDGI